MSIRKPDQSWTSHTHTRAHTRFADHLVRARRENGRTLINIYEDYLEEGGSSSPSIQTFQTHKATVYTNTHTHSGTCTPAFYALISLHPSPPPSCFSTTPGPLKDFHCNLHAGERGDDLNNLLTGASPLSPSRHEGEGKGAGELPRERC